MGLVGLALILALVVTGCSGASQASVKRGVSQGSYALDFTLEAPDGSESSLSDYGGSVVLVNFWATWCPPCRAEMPSMQRAWKEVAGEDILILGVNVGEDAGTIDEFIRQVPVEFPLPMDRNSTVVQTWPMRGLPTTFVVDPDGRLAYRAEGEREWDDPALLDQVRALK